jgi:regulator of replication initiation timing
LQEFIGQLDDEMEEMQAALLHLHHQNLELTKERDDLRSQLSKNGSVGMANIEVKHDSENAGTGAASKETVQTTSSVVVATPNNGSTTEASSTQLPPNS